MHNICLPCPALPSPAPFHTVLPCREGVGCSPQASLYHSGPSCREHRPRADPVPSNLPTTMHSTPHSPLSSSTSDHPDEAPPGSNVLPLRRTPVWSKPLLPIGASQQRSMPVPEPRPQAASENATTPRGSDEPAWRQAFIAPNGVRFTRTPDRIHRERMSEANKAGVSEGEDHPIAPGMSFGQPDPGSDPEAPALSSAQPDLNCLAPTGVTDHLSFWFQDRYQVQQCAAA